MGELAIPKLRPKLNAVASSIARLNRKTQEQLILDRDPATMEALNYTLPRPFMGAQNRAKVKEQQKTWSNDRQANTKSEVVENGIKLDIPEVFVPLLMEPARMKCAYGGRGSAKSWSIARALIAKAHTSKLLILCAREFQNSIQDSVIRLLEAQINDLGLATFFDIQKNTIIHKKTGSEFIFKGLHRNVMEIKSTEGVDICWVEEAQTVTEDSWNVLIPTIRKPGSEIWVSFNPLGDKDPTYKRFVINPPPFARVKKVSWRDNPFFEAEMDQERRYMLRVDPEMYGHIWEGAARQITNATIFKGKFRVDNFETPEHLDRFFYGADFGFAQDPSTLMRCFIHENRLFVDWEAYEIGVEIDDLPRLYDRVPGAREWPIKADGSRPETISYVRRRGFNINPAEKWPGSVEDGIAHLKGFEEIVVHERCTHCAEEMRLYSYKTDKLTNEVLPVPLDKHNHTIDSLRYALDGYIQARGGIGIWYKLAG